jgi:hypothetical protein
MRESQREKSKTCVDWPGRRLVLGGMMWPWIVLADDHCAALFPTT